MDYGDFNMDTKMVDKLLESGNEDENSFDIAKFLTNSNNQNYNNNSSKCSTDDICAQTIRTAFMMAENEHEIHLDNNELLSELSSVTNNFFSQLNNDELNFNETNATGQNIHNSVESIGDPEDGSNIFCGYLNSNINPDIDNILPSIACTLSKTLDVNNNSSNTRLGFISTTEPQLEQTATNLPQHGNPYCHNISQNMPTFKQPPITTFMNTEIMDNASVGIFNTIQMTRDTKKPKRKRAASDREKNRTQSVNTAFQKLRTLIPTEPVDRKLSKVETLRLAISYITHLGSTLEADVSDDQPCMRKYARFEWETEKSVCTFCMSNTKTFSRDGFTK